MKQLQRLLIQQGHKCFFCAGAIPPGEASVEHLDALSNGGERTDQNCVVCCRALNTALGNLSIKDKFRAILSQPHPFLCPIAVPQDRPPEREAATSSNLIDQAVSMLERYGKHAPRRKTKLFNALRTELPNVTNAELDALFDELTL